MESSARYQFLELNMDVIGIPSIALIDSSVSHCLVDGSLVHTALLTILEDEKLKVTIVNRSLPIYTVVCLVSIDFVKGI